MLTLFHLLTFVLFCVGLTIILFNNNVYNPKILMYSPKLIINKNHNYEIKDLYKKRLPSAVIIGVKKCGTRALLHFLKIHPKIKVVGPEIHFFDREHIYEKGIEWYIKQMPRSRSDQITIEKTPSYYVTSHVPARMRRTLPGRVKLIVVVRDPVTRALSDFVQASSKRTSDPYLQGRPFESLAFFNGPSETLCPHNHSSTPETVLPQQRQINTNWSAIKLGAYATYLPQWVPHFDLGRDMHFVDGEQLITDPARVVAGVERFLALPPYIRADMFVYRPHKHFPCLRVYTYNNKSDRLDCLGHTKGRPHPIVCPQTIQSLREYYKPFNLLFFKMINQTFDWY